MHIITRKRLNDFAVLYPDVKTALQHWYRVVKTKDFNSFNELKTLFPHADQVGKLTVFNIAGNKVRLIAAIHNKTATESISAMSSLTPNTIKTNGRNNMSAVYLEQITPVWNNLSKFVHVLHSERDYAQAVELLDSLIDTVGENEKHPLASLMELVGVLIEQYEEAFVPEITDL